MIQIGAEAQPLGAGPPPYLQPNTTSGAQTIPLGTLVTIYGVRARDSPEVVKFVTSFQYVRSLKRRA